MSLSFTRLTEALICSRDAIRYVRELLPVGPSPYKRDTLTPLAPRGQEKTRVISIVKEPQPNHVDAALPCSSERYKKSTPANATSYSP
jgi:hypothetical protein